VAPIEFFEQMLGIALDAASNINTNGVRAVMNFILIPEASVEVVRLLLAYNPDNIAIKMASSSFQHYPIHQAMSHECMDIIESLLNMNTNVQMALQKKTIGGDTCLYVALKGRVWAKTICDFLAISPKLPLSQMET
jgi:ankyrin repeat protein